MRDKTPASKSMVEASKHELRVKTVADLRRKAWALNGSGDDRLTHQLEGRIGAYLGYNG